MTEDEKTKLTADIAHYGMAKACLSAAEMREDKVGEDCWATSVMTLERYFEEDYGLVLPDQAERNTHNY